MIVNLNHIDKLKAFVAIAEQLNGDVILKSGRYQVNGKSILGIISLDLTKNLILELQDEDKYELFDKFASEQV